MSLVIHVLDTEFDFVTAMFMKRKKMGKHFSLCISSDFSLVDRSTIIAYFTGLSISF